jgi:hypothetical protein
MAPIQEGSGNVPQQAFVQWNDPKGTKLAAVNRDGSVFSTGYSTPTNPNGTSLKFKIVRTNYTITDADVAEGYAEIIISVSPITSANFTLLQGLTRPVGVAPDHNNDYSLGDNHVVSLPATSITQELYVNGSSATAGDVVIIDTMIIQD